MKADGQEFVTFTEFVKRQKHQVLSFLSAAEGGDSIRHGHP